MGDEAALNDRTILIVIAIMSVYARLTWTGSWNVRFNDRDGCESCGVRCCRLGDSAHFKAALKSLQPTMAKLQVGL